MPSKGILARWTELLAETELARERQNHFVQFYEDPHFLADTVAFFIGSGLSNQESAIVIATPEHNSVFLKCLERDGFDTEGLRSAGQLLVLDAHHTLSSFMVRGSADAERFENKFGALLQQMQTKFGAIRAYGEMVQLLWNEGNAAATLQLEKLWNDLARKHAFSLLCGYSLKNFRGGQNGFNEICGSHSHVLPTERYLQVGTTDEQLRVIADLEHQSNLLRTELEKRKRAEKKQNEVERELRESNEKLKKELEDHQRTSAKLRESEEDLKRLLLDLRQSKNELDVILHGVTDGITVLDTNGKFVYANRVAAKLCGYGCVTDFLNATTREVMDAFEILDEQDNPFPHEKLPGRLALKGTKSPPETIVKFRAKKTGETRWSIVNAAPVFDESGEVKFAISIFRDFTDRKAFERSLQLLADAGSLLASSLEYKETLQSIAKLVVPSMADWCTIAVKQTGKAAPQIVAVAHKELEKIKWARQIQEKYPPNWDSPRGSGNVIRTGKSEIYPEISEQLIRASAIDETHFKILRELGMKSAMVVPLKSRNLTLGAITLIAAESGRQYTEADLRVAEELAYRAGTAVENALLYKKAQASIQARDEFLSIASHELKTPITSLRMQLEMTKRKLGLRGKEALSLEKLERVFSMSCKQVERLTTLVDDMLDISRIQAGKLNLELDEVNLSALVRELYERFQDQFDTAQCQVTLELDEPVIGRWDHNRIEQVAVNLFTNALKYAAGKPIEISVRRSPSSAQIIVKDSGPGIPKEKQSLIFERFERATTSRSIAGLGLGLFIVKQIVEAHNGGIRLESAKGEGAKFTVELPLMSG
ncbi:MAG: ATP-binding protein [Bdellovibrionota bacterium]